VYCQAELRLSGEMSGYKAQESVLKANDYVDVEIKDLKIYHTIFDDSLNYEEIWKESIENSEITDVSVKQCMVYGVAVRQMIAYIPPNAEQL
jgi:hypothetical protein